MNNLEQKDLKKIESVIDKIREIFIAERGRTPRRQLAEKLDINESTALRLENGEHDLDMRYFLKICKIYELDPALTLQKALLTA